MGSREGRGRRQWGFSLVEVAIVLVVIGIVLGAVLQGRSLIASAEYKSFRQQLRDYRGAFNNFRERYDALPGDFNEADDRLGLDASDNGDGNGVVDNSPDCLNETDESCLAWQHLRAAGMLGGNPKASGSDASPETPYGGVVSSFFTGDEGNTRFEHKLLVTAVPTDIARRLDREEDDGLCDEGRISARSGCTGSDDDDWPSTSATVELIYAL